MDRGGRPCTDWNDEVGNTEKYGRRGWIGAVLRIIGLTKNEACGIG